MAVTIAVAIASAVFVFVTDSVRGLNSSGNHIYGYRERHIVYGFIRYAGLFGDSAEHFVVDFVGADILKADRKTYGQAEVENFVKFFFGAVLEYQLAESSECDHFAVIVLGVGREKGKTVVDSVGSSKTAGLESETAKKNVGFDNLFESGSYDVVFASGFGFCAVAQQGFIAKFCHCESCHGAVTEHSALFTIRTARKTCVDVGVGIYVCASFEVSGERVAHAGYEEAYGSVSYDGGVDKNYARALTEVCIIVKVVVGSIKNGAMAGRSVGCRDGRADDEVATGSYALSGVDCFTATETDGASALILFCKRSESFNFLTGAFATEITGYEFDVELLLSGFEFVGYELFSKRVGDKESFLTEGLYKITEVKEFVFALNVLGGAYKCFSHYNISPCKNF